MKLVKTGIAILFLFMASGAWAETTVVMPTLPKATVQLGGFMILDDFNFAPDLPNEKMTSQSAGRALRIQAGGTIGTKWKYFGQYDFAGNAVRVRHAWIAYQAAAGTDIKIGQQPLPYGLESTTSIKNQVLMERAMFHRAWGIDFFKAVSWDQNGKTWLSSLGVFGDSETDNANPDRTHAINWRFVWAPVETADQIFHVGFVVNRESFMNAAAARFKVSPGINMSGTSPVYLIDTGSITHSDYLYKGGGELLYAYRNFGVLGEYNQVDLHRTAGLSDLHFDGYYGDLIWMITGEKVAYNHDGRVLGAVKPNGQNGAWALTARYDHLNLNDRDVQGGTETDTSLAGLWWPNSNLKFMAEYTKAFSEKNSVTNNPSVVAFRVQVAF